MKLRNKIRLQRHSLAFACSNVCVSAVVGGNSSSSSIQLSSIHPCCSLVNLPIESFNTIALRS